MANRVISGIGWSTTSTVARSLVGFLQIAILTRFLSKGDFGIIAIAGLFVNFTSLFMDMGISTGIIHRRKITNNEYSSLFWLNILSGTLLTLILFFIAPLLTKAYKTDEITNVVRWLCLGIFLGSLGNQQRIVCQKLTYFKRLAIIEILTSAITFIIAVTTAWKGLGVYSLVYSTLGGTLFNNITHLSFGLLKDNRLSFHFRLSETFPFLKIGIFNVGATMLDFFARELDIIIISATLGLEFLGVYNLAKKIPIVVYGFVSPILSRVFVPLLAEINNDITAMKGYVKFLLSICSILMSPVYFIIATIAPTIMFLAFGSDFVCGSSALSVIAIIYSLNVVGGICSMAQVPLGRTDIGLYWTIFRIITTAVFYYISSLFGVNWFLVGMLLHSLICAIVVWRMQGYVMLGLSFKEYFGSFIKPIVTCTILSLICIVICYKPSIVFSIIESIIFIVLYLFLLLITSKHEVITTLKRFNILTSICNFLEKQD